MLDDGACFITAHNRSAVEVVLPLLVGVLHEPSWVRLTCKFLNVRNLRQHVHIPDGNNEISEIVVTLKLSRNNLMVLAEILESDFTVVSEVLVCAVQVCEQVVELKAGFFNGLDASFDIGVAGRIKMFLHFVQVQSAVFVGIEVSESFFNQSLALCGQRTDKNVHKLSEVNVAVAILIEALEQPLDLALTEIGNLQIVHGLLELGQVEMATAIGVHYSKLTFEADEAAHASSLQGLSQSNHEQVALLFAGLAVHLLGII